MSGKPDDFSASFMSPRNVLEGVFEKFLFRGFPKQLKTEGDQTGTLLRPTYSPRDTCCREILFTPLVVQGLGSFRGQSTLYTTFQIYGASNFPNFRILVYFSHTKRLKSTFQLPACNPGVMLRSASGYPV